MSTTESGEAALDPHLVHDIASRHPEVTSLAAAGLSRIEHAELMGLVPLGLPLPKGKRDLLVPLERKEAVLREVEGGLQRALRRNALLEQGRRALAGSHLSLKAAEDRTRVIAVAHEILPWPGFREPLRLHALKSFDADELADRTDTELLARLAGDPDLGRRAEEAVARVSERLQDLATRVGQADDSWTFENLVERLSRAARNRHDPNDILRRWEETFDTWLGERAQARGRAFVDTHFDLARFEQLFPVARGLGRKLVLVVGPTNSGKTHRAVEALKAAKSGIYLAPLRLLALEIMDRLNNEGTPTTLLTGEEEIRVPEARHIASTIEMLDPERPVDVVVIDEVQMLADPDRGWAWTAALMGAPGRTVYILGAPEARPLVEKAAAHLGEPLEVIELDRKGPLILLENRVEWADVQRGDALIAFSRREVHAVRETVQARGLAAAVIYGALAPDVRRREAERFLSGEADVVVATDAIGMGLNLPVRRILFTALEKFDGNEVRPLATAEIKQIAGRAGRFGKVDVGEFGVVGRGTPQALKALLNRPDPRLGPSTPLKVRPTRGMLQRLARHIGSEDLVLLLDCFATAKTAGSPYRVADLGPVRRLAAMLDERPLDFADKLDLLFIPADMERDTDADLFRSVCRAILRDTPLALDQVVPARIDTLDTQQLEDASRVCDLYYWAARKFPRLFPDRERVRVRRAAIGERLSEVLAARSRRSRTQAAKPGFRGAPRKRYGPRRR
ncbi:MAG TPA: helicase-related protein [Azospirillaceae bacterium]|nr:helicase-related protein [Azospirillaceae bacterium]